MGTYDDWKLACPPDEAGIDECGAGCGEIDGVVKERLVDGLAVYVCRRCADRLDDEAALAADLAAEEAERLALRPDPARVLMDAGFAALAGGRR